MPRLEGLVAALLNDRELAINIGEKDGVHEGMRFEILAKDNLTVKDPSTGEELGKLDTVKVRVKVSEVKEKFAVARTYETYKVNEGGTAPPGIISGVYVSPDNPMYSMMTPPRWVTRVVTLRRDKGEMPGRLAAYESIVDIGDVVRLALD